MKRIYSFSLLLFVFCLPNLFSQSCPYNLSTITLSSQQQIDNFASTYPGTVDFNRNIRIKESSPGNITNLNGLSQIELIRGCLTISFNESLTDLSGLENLYYVGKDIDIRKNDALRNLNGLNSLNAVRSSIYIRFNQSLENFVGLGAVSRVEDNMYVDHNDALVNFEGLENLKTIEEDLRIEDNETLENLAGLEALEIINRGLRITGNNNLSSLTGIDDLLSNTLDYALIQENPNLSMCGVPSMCWYAHDGRGVFAANAIGCSSQQEVADGCTPPDRSCLPDGITFTSQEQIDNFRINYPDCWDIGGDVTISSSVITNANGLNMVANIDGDLKIQNNPLLTGFGGWNLRSINGELRLDNNDVLISPWGLRYVDPNSITYLSIQNNPVLQGCGSYMNSFCSYVWGPNPYDIINNPGWGCSSAQEIMIQCSLPITLASFTASIRNKTVILTWQTATETNSDGFEIQKSRNGTNWEKIGWQQAQGNSTTAHTYSYTDKNPLVGTTYYRLKQIDLDSSFEFSDAVSIKYKGSYSISLYPNPAKDILTINLDGYTAQEFAIYDQTGKEVITKKDANRQINISELTSGVYILKAMIDEEVFYEKFVVE